MTQLVVNITKLGNITMDDNITKLGNITTDGSITKLGNITTEAIYQHGG